MDRNEFSRQHPRLYHMAEAGSWPSIQEHGLLSTTASLDLMGVTGQDRRALEHEHRCESAILSKQGIGSIVLRDQRPMPPSRLEKALRNNVTPGDWYAFLNSRVFLWANRGRVDGLLNAKSYRGRSHDVLTLDTKKLVSERGGDALLSHMNSGNTFPYPHERDFDIFKSIEAYPVNTKGNPVKPVAEFTLHYSVPNISDYVLDVETTKGGP